MPTDTPVITQHNGADHHGLLIHQGSGARPTVLVFHDWAGRTESQEGFARRVVAGFGYNAFNVDLYGGGRSGSTPEENQALMGPLASDRTRLRKLLLETVDAVAARPEADAGKLAAIGFCFGGLCVLDLARAGGKVRGVASFHGLFNPPGLPSAPITARIVAYHGWDDPMAKPEDVVALGNELTAVGADWRIDAFGGAKHAFMNEQANAPAMGLQYNATVAKRAWISLGNFLEEVLA